MFLRFVVATLLVQLANGFSSGAAGCEGDGPGIGGAHLDLRNGKTSELLTFASRNVVVTVGADIIPLGGTITVKTGTTTPIVVKGTNIKGVLMRVSGPIGYPTAGVIDLGLNTAVAKACLAPAVGITHTSANDKDSVSGSLFFTKITTTVDLKLDLTLVWFNSDKESKYSYQQYPIKVTQGPPNNAPTPPPVAPPKCGFGSFQTAGSTTVLPVSQGWATEYNKLCPDPKVTANGGGSSAGPRRGCNSSDVVEVASMSRPWTEKEATVAADGWTYTCKIGTTPSRVFQQVDVAIDGVPIIIERLNGTAKDCFDKLPGNTISSQQLRWMFTNLSTVEMGTVPNSDGNGETRLWSELNAGCKPLPIIVAGPSSIYGTYDFFKEIMFTAAPIGSESFRKEYVPLADNSNELRNFILNTDGAIGYLGYSYYNRNKLSLKAVAIDGIEPSTETLSKATYVPLGRRIYSSFLKTDESMGKTKCWLDFGLSDIGASIVEQTGFLPIPVGEYPFLRARVTGSCIQAPTPAPVAKPTLAPIAPVPAPVTPPTRAPCFSTMSSVEIKDQGVVSISQVKVGDYVKSSNGDFTQVYGLGHFDPDFESEFLQLYFAISNNQSDVKAYNAEPLEVTSKHLLFVERSGRQYPVRASDVVIGDKLSDKIVASIGKVTRRGLYSPLTQSGDIVVSGIVASTYVDLLDYTLGFDQHTLGHAVFAPQRMFCSYFIDTCKKESYVNGLGPLANIIVNAAEFSNSLGWFANMILSILSVLVVGVVYMLESTMVVSGFVVLAAMFTMTARRSA